MLETVYVASHSLDVYKTSAGKEAVAEIRELAESLKGARVLHVNATSFGGGVAEILRTEIPLLRDIGIEAEWRTIVGEYEYFQITKKMHNGLQGGELELTAAEQAMYLEHAEGFTKSLENHFDIIVVHDPQPLPLLNFFGRQDSRWIWRCHIDTAQPNPQVWDFLRPLLDDYDASVFTLDSFVPSDIPVKRVEIIPPAIDPESPKNIDLGMAISLRVLSWLGVDVEKPVIAQISRFDPWKDPLGVIEAYKLVEKDMPATQLALVGSMAHDDPEGAKIYDEVLSAAKAEKNIHVFTNVTGAGNIEVNAFQRLAVVAVQKSIREGFGLTVSEALWKGTPVIGGNVGGIPLQIANGSSGYLVSSPEECAEKILWYLEHPTERAVMGARGREDVRQKFLITRLIADELRLYASLLGEA